MLISLETLQNQSRLNKLFFLIKISFFLMTSSILRLLVFRKVLLLTDGRDKSLKLIQYLSKLLIWAQVLNGKQIKRATNLASQLSLTRKIIRLAHWLDSVNDLANLKQMNWYPLFYAFNSILNGNNLFDSRCRG